MARMHPLAHNHKTHMHACAHTQPEHTQIEQIDVLYVERESEGGEIGALEG